MKLDFYGVEERTSSTAESVSELEENLPKWSRSNLPLLLLSGFGLIAAVYVIFYSYFSSVFPRGQHTVAFLGMSLAWFIAVDFLEREKSDNRIVRALDALLSLAFFAITVGVTGYFFAVFEDLISRVSLLVFYPHEYILGALILVVVVEMTRRAYGTIFTSIIYVGILYLFFGEHVPGRLGHTGLSTNRILEELVITYDGIYGFIPKLGATWVAALIIWVGLLHGYGAKDFFFDIGFATAGNFRSGIAQIAIIASMVFGSFNGGASQNVATTGAFTIPLMKENGLEAESAGAIESVASSGGQIMPPIMGVAAFLIAEYLAISYGEVIIAAFLPAVLYFAILAVNVDIISLKQGIEEPGDQFAEHHIGVTVLNGSHYLISIGVLLYFLAYLQYSVLYSTFMAIIALILSVYALSAIKAVTNGESGERSVVRNLSNTTSQTVHGLIRGIQITAPLMILLTAIGMMVTIVTLTGINQTISVLMFSIGDAMLVLLLLGALLSIIFGMGLPTVAAYVLVVIFVAPPLTEFGISELHTHFFIFYFAVISGITPPIAIAVAVASTIADSDFLRTCWQAVKLALPIYMLPFAFIFNSELLTWNVYTPVVFPVVLVGLVCLIIGIQGFPALRDAGNRAHTPIRVLTFLIGLPILFWPNLMVQAAIAVVAFVMSIYPYYLSGSTEFYVPVLSRVLPE
jgi:TRAP transporter 4TM/12TM fusion protein